MLPIQAYRITVSFSQGSYKVCYSKDFFSFTFLQRVYCLLLYNTSLPRNTGFLWHLILWAGKQQPRSLFLILVQVQHNAIIIYYKSPISIPPPPTTYRKISLKQLYWKSENNEPRLRAETSNLAANYVPLISCDSTNFIIFGSWFFTHLLNDVLSQVFLV